MSGGGGGWLATVCQYKLHAGMLITSYAGIT